MTDRHVTPFRHIVLTPSQPVSILTPSCFLFSGETTNTNLMVMGLTWPGIELIIYPTWHNHANYYTIRVVKFCTELLMFFTISKLDFHVHVHPRHDKILLKINLLSPTLCQRINSRHFTVLSAFILSQFICQHAYI